MPKAAMAVVLAAGLATFAGCAVGPDYVRPGVEAPSAYKELAGWKEGSPVCDFFHVAPPSVERHNPDCGPPAM